MSQNLDNVRLEYQTLVEGMKAVFDSYYKLATMTFTWNASLGTAIAFLSKDMNSIDIKIICFGLAFLATFYNCAALVSYNSTVKVFKTLRLQTLELVGSQEDFQASKSLLSGKKDHNWNVEILISGVLVIMILIWLIILGWVAL